MRWTRARAGWALAAVAVLLAGVVLVAAPRMNADIVSRLVVVAFRYPPVAMTAGPSVQTEHVDDDASMVVHLRDVRGRPSTAVPVIFAVSGANAGIVGICEPANCATDVTGDVRFRYLGASIGSDLVTVSPPRTVAPTQVRIDWRPSIKGAPYAILGDSYSAGEGTSDYVAGTAVPGLNQCHRSLDAYGPLVAHALDIKNANRACSGAVTDDFFASNSGGNQLDDGVVEPAQLCVDCAGGLPAAVGPSTRNVTFTIGGNDVGFTSVLASCIWASEANLNYGRPGRGCSSRTAITDPVRLRLAALAGFGTATAPEGRPVHAISEILARVHALAPSAHVYLLGYPQLLAAGSGDCNVGQVEVEYAGRHLTVATKVTPRDAQWLDSVADILDATGRQAVNSAGAWATFVDGKKTFAGHGICGGQSWMNPVGGSLAIQSFQHVEVDINSGSMHPTASGQAAYAAALRAAGFGRL